MPLGLSTSYLTLPPLGISMTAKNSSGASGPGSRSCHGWVTSSAALARHGHEADRNQVLRNEAPAPAPPTPQHLLVSVPYGSHHAPAIGELVDQRLGKPGRRSGEQDGVEGRGPRQAAASVGGDHEDVPVSQLAQGARGPAREN